MFRGASSAYLAYNFYFRVNVITTVMIGFFCYSSTMAIGHATVAITMNDGDDGGKKGWIHLK